MFIKPHRPLFILLAWLAVVWATKACGAVSAAEGDGLLNLDWRVYVAAKPVYCLLVEKDRQRLRVLRHDGRLQVVAEFEAATGENPGPKEREGDARTPEGIYLVTKGYLDTKISVFGNRAYELNYPNWFDLGAGRGGNGIYLHGTNRPLQPMSSNGCVTLENSDLERLADYLAVGTPVFIVPTLEPAAEPSPKGKGQEGYPDLTGGGFAGARALLLPEGGEADFASLYLIRIKDQTMVAGEYWPTPDSSTTRQTVAYLHQAPDHRWAVVDRGPLAGEQEREEMVTIAGLPPELRREVEEAGEGDWPSVAPLLWEPAPEALTLEWFREATIPPPAPVSTPPPAVAGSAGVKAELVYALFGLATCLSIGSALLLIRRRGAGGGGEGAGPEADGAFFERVRDEVTQAREALQSVQARMDKETRLMESQEALKARVEGLETAFGEKQAAIERLHAEQAAMREQGLSERSGLVEELGQVRGELAAVRAELETARQEMAARSEQAGTVHEQLAEVKRLATERQEPALAMDVEVLKGVVTDACDQLREQVQAMLETVPHPEAAHAEESAERGGHEALLAEIRSYALEMRAAQAEMSSRLGGVTDSGEVAVALEALHLELREAEREKTELLSRLSRMNELEASLAERDRGLLSLRTEGEEARGRLLAAKGEWESRLSVLDEELQAERAAKTELTSRLTRLSELEESAAARESALQALREEGEMSRKRAVSEKVDLESRLAALGEELQAAQEAKRELASRLLRMSALEATVAEQGRELLALRQADEETRGRAATAKDELESRLATLSEELREEREAKRELASRLTRLNELDAALAERERELQSLREANEQLTVSSATEKGRLEATIAELVLSRQVEVTSLSSAAQEAKEKAAAEQEAMAVLRHEVESVQAAWRQATEREQAAEQHNHDQERVVAELTQEVAAFKTKVAELEQKATMGDGVVLIKGSHYLPGDVLRKWIGKEQ